MQDNLLSKDTAKRYATTAIVLGGGAVLGTSFLTNNYSTSQQNYGAPFSYNGQRYYVPNDSRRAVYPSRDDCLRDVPLANQSECEPVSNYRGGGAGYYGPLYSPRNASGPTSGTAGYQPSSLYPTETANSSNFGKKLPSSANTTGFGANGKAFTGSKGG